jgi:NTE family protein
VGEKPKIGLALSGGVGYCLAHIGVLKALEEESIAIDCLAGTSGGALIGCLYASGIKADRLEQIAQEISWARLMAPTLVIKNKGLVSSEPIEKLVDELIGKDRRFSELKLPLSVVAVDLISGSEVVFPQSDEDLIAPAVRASCSVPVVYAPVKMGDWLLSDGGIKAPLPVEALKRCGVDLIIGVAFEPGRYEPTNLFEIGNRSMLLASESLLELYENELDVLVKVKTGEVVSWDFSAAQSLIEVGYQAAREKLGRIRERVAGRKADA